MFNLDCDSIADANKWRHELISEITKKISEIKNASIGEHRIREINDEINKLMKTKYHWYTHSLVHQSIDTHSLTHSFRDKRIVELGGAEVGRKKQFYDIEGKELPGQPGYKYYGAAKDLPGTPSLTRSFRILLDCSFIYFLTIAFRCERIICRR